MVRIVVLGAGVVGLTSALELKKKYADAEITVIAKNLPGDISTEYTSPFAGANWQSFAKPEDTRLQGFEKIAYKKLFELAEKVPASGVGIVKDEVFISKYGTEADRQLPWYKDFVEDFEVLDEKKLPEDTVCGFLYKTVIISVPIYLHYLLQELLRSGVVVKRVKQLKNIEEARHYHHSGKIADVVVNCAGVLVSQLKGFEDDKRNYRVRGQVLLVSNNAKKITVVEPLSPDVEDEILYVFPRKEGGSILGGCFIEDTTEKEDIGMTKRIIQRAKKYAPELVDTSFKNNSLEIEIVRVNIGLRPMRETGARVEQDPQHSWLIHNYGAGAGGYQGSWGFAAQVVRLVGANAALKPNAKL